MIKHNQDGVSGVGVSLVLTIVLLVGAIGFGIWSFSSRQDYKNNTDAKVASAVQTAKQQEDVIKEKQFAEESKSPLTTYAGPEAYGSIILQYPKTWSSYIIDSSSSDSNSSNPINAYFHPGSVPSVDGDSSIFSLRLQVLSQSYLQTLDSINSGASSSSNPAVVKPYALPKVPKTIGVEVTGTLPISGSGGKKTGIMVVLPLRSQTLELWTEGNQYQADFNRYILPNFSFSP
ncbi:MAG TPA: hypothetical protein VHA05_00385 [Candidatus Saccharimonadales bacterium]|nr:hypothetical protein [Candidatus Saccharimonadales bacterium]